MIKYFLSVFIIILSLWSAPQAEAQNAPQALIGGDELSLLKSSEAQELPLAMMVKNDTLYSALATAYQNNPSLRAARAELLAVYEQLPQAQAGFKPTISLDGDITHSNTEAEGDNFFIDEGGNTSKSASLNLSQPIFKGGKTLADTRQARNVIMAQELALSAIEQQIIFEATQAYMDVLRDQAVLQLNEENQLLVSKELEQAENRFSVGELTRTDVSQSKARLAAAQANVINARGDLKATIANYQRLSGSPLPADMGYPLEKFEIPANLEEALSLAQSNNRMVLQAQLIAAAAKDGVNSASAELLPQIFAIGRLDKSYAPSQRIDEQRQSAIGLSASIPLYQAGSTRSRIREAQKRASQRNMEILEAQEQAKADAIQNWEGFQAAISETKARQAQIEAARIAREGVHYETEFGERTTLDSLNANQELLDAQVSLIEAKRNEVVARFALAQSLGILVPQNLGFASITP